ncbi:SDR family NAD(P)-dependent oxidoreductase [Hyphomicrobium facile]|uniref:3-hydroxybutyrate dehydrogenase n=1 Tax=Hyphomicrobium facile TaxID=51670 RepID=A0A1I7MTV4_9HYPH|nr:SDR family NAD(P)-dependent oxidoreductase [Hyphomicrobium facile]SFV25832.1 3-hydroxybutyrate dehydrogenase [Hyphomicrobium facile]
MINFQNKSVLVTGASRGIGFAVAEALAVAGADVAILANDDLVTDAAARLSDACGRPVQAFFTDITDKTALQTVFASISTLDVLVNNAGLELITPLTDPSDEVDATFARIIDINVRGTWNVTRAALPLLKPGARIINTASVWAKSAVGEFAAYIASKHAVVGLTRTFARELGPRGIAVNAVCPGWVRTVASVRSAKTMAERTERSEADIFADVVAAQALPGLMEPADVAGLYLFLASDLSNNITGQAIGVDRGEFLG